MQRLNLRFWRFNLNSGHTAMLPVIIIFSAKIGKIFSPLLLFCPFDAVANFTMVRRRSGNIPYCAVILLDGFCG
jgi:hypothetical protein